MAKPKKNPEAANTGRLLGMFISNPRYFGFITPETAGEVDVFVPPHHTLGAMSGDMVSYKITKEKSTHDGDKPSCTGQVLEIVKRGQMVGTYHTIGAAGFVRPSESKIPHTFPVLQRDIKKFALADGHVVAFQVPTSQDKDFCVVKEVIGHSNDPGVDVLAMVRQAGIPMHFPPEVETEAASLPLKVTPKERKGRLDLRKDFIFTIDGDNTKDIDDAISFEVLPCGHIKLGVHIADVTHYVQEETPLDVSALDRGTSVYLADRVIPMLPHTLSSGICSLFPDVDRLALSCIMTICPKGHVVDYHIAKTVIHSKLRLTYQGVQDVLDKKKGEHHQLFAQMDKLRKILYRKRKTRGALDFDLPESKIRVDETGWPISVEAHVRTQSTGIIEEFMILCNETIAGHFLALALPFVYRTHEAPGADKAAKLKTLTKHLGMNVPKSLDKPKALQRFLAAAAKTEGAQAIATAVLHSLPQARYTTDKPTHYGLASQGYSHFTSPIRRYSDLQIHRIIKEWLDGAVNTTHYEAILPEVCAQCSRAERVAETLERDVAQLKKVQYMMDEKGKSFTGVVSGVTPWGVYVTLPNTVEGQIPIENLKRNKYGYNKEKGLYTLATKTAKKKSRPVKKAASQKPDTLTHGVVVNVRLTHASIDERKLIFALEV